MAAHKLTHVRLVPVALLVIIPGLWSQAYAADPAFPTLSETQRAFLSRVARRTVRDVALGRDRYEPEYVPASLRSLTAEVIVRLRQSGYLLASSAAGPGPIAMVARDAAWASAGRFAGDEEFDLDAVNDVLIELEIIQPAESIPSVQDWTSPGLLDSILEPGVDGLVLAGPRINYRFCPTELFTRDLTLDEALEQVAQATQSSGATVLSIQVQRFRTQHWHQAKPGGKIVSLRRGLTVVPPEAVSRKELDQSIALLAEYMAYRQLESGLFTYQFEPGKDRYAEGQSFVRQIGSVLSMAIHASDSGSDASRGAADLGIRYFLKGLVQIPGIDNAAFIATPDGRNKLGATALLCLAMAHHPDREGFVPIRKKLVNGMLTLQQPSGAFMTAFPPAPQIDAQEYFPGEALLSMAAHYAEFPQAEILDAFHRAISFYREYFRDRRHPAMVPWQVQAFAIMARHGRRQDYIDYVFELTDWLGEKQLTPSNCEWPELHGGIASHREGYAGVSTASYLEGFAEALALARSVGDSRRSKRYESLVRASARFVMQLQIRPEEAYFIRSPRDAIGGIRKSPSLPLLRISYCRHALIGLIKTRKVLYPHGD